MYQNRIDVSIFLNNQFKSIVVQRVKYVQFLFLLMSPFCGTLWNWRAQELHYSTSHRLFRFSCAYNK